MQLLHVADSETARDDGFVVCPHFCGFFLNFNPLQPNPIYNSNPFIVKLHSEYLVARFAMPGQPGLGGLMVTHSAAGAKGPWFDSPVDRAHLIFNSLLWPLLWEATVLAVS